jgi:hypothetical protein
VCVCVGVGVGVGVELGPGVYVCVGVGVGVGVELGPGVCVCVGVGVADGGVSLDNSTSGRKSSYSPAAGCRTWAGSSSAPTMARNTATIAVRKRITLLPD